MRILTLQIFIYTVLSQNSAHLCKVKISFWKLVEWNPWTFKKIKKLLSNLSFWKWIIQESPFYDEFIWYVKRLRTLVHPSTHAPYQATPVYIIHNTMGFFHSGRQHNKYFKTNQSGCLRWFYLITATCFGPYFGPSSGSFIKYVSRYWNIFIWVHISFKHCNYY
jgi:hypothetical protein